MRFSTVSGFAGGGRCWRSVQDRGRCTRSCVAAFGGPVDTVEPSATFRTRLRALCARDGFGHGTVWSSTLSDTSLPRRHYDLIFARWVLLFLPDPARHIQALAASLKPGGLLAIEDYRRETLSMIPTPPEWPDVHGALTPRSSQTQGGDASIAGSLPTLYERAGLEVTDITPTIRTGHSGIAGVGLVIELLSRRDESTRGHRAVQRGSGTATAPTVDREQQEEDIAAHRTHAHRRGRPAEAVGLVIILPCASRPLLRPASISPAARSTSGRSISFIPARRRSTRRSASAPAHASNHAPIRASSFDPRTPAPPSRPTTGASCGISASCGCCRCSCISSRPAGSR